MNYENNSLGRINLFDDDSIIAKTTLKPPSSLYFPSFYVEKNFFKSINYLLMRDIFVVFNINCI